jgi:hypothetical protein
MSEALVDGLRRLGLVRECRGAWRRVRFVIFCGTSSLPSGWRFRLKLHLGEGFEVIALTF